MKEVLKVVLFGSLFAIPMLTLYVENDYFFPFITGKNFWFRILVEIGFASWMLLALYDRAYRPRFSWILASFGTLIVVMFFANLFGEYPHKSFWSNFERMDGFVTLSHVFVYFVVLGSTITTHKLWTYFLHTSLVVAFFVALYGLGQYAGVIDGYRGRIDSRLGNAAYMAIYMLFHVFIAMWLFVESRVHIYRAMYGLLTVTFVFTLFQTATRGTAVGLVVGVIVMAAYIGLFGSRYKEFRKYAIGVFAILVLSLGAFIVAKDSQFVKDNRILNRMASISLEEMQVRFMIWNMAAEGVKERPLMGWGQGNFNYVFNEQYDPQLYAQEQWFDRVHNIFFDWLVAGGILGFIAYFGILFSVLYYLFWIPLFREADAKFNVLERGILIGLIAGYFTHNLVVFDNIISYIFYGTILALIHSRVATEIPSIMRWRLNEKLVTQLVAPVVVIAIGFTAYYVNVPSMRASADIIDAFRASDPLVRLAEFDEALNRNSFADQEIVEQLAQQAMNMAANPNLDAEAKAAFIKRAELETLRMIDEKPGDARLHVFLSSFYRALGSPEAIKSGKEQAAIARQLSPQKQSVIIQQGVLELADNNAEAATEFFKEAYELATDNKQAKELYATGLIQTEGTAAAKEVIGDDETVLRNLAMSDYAVGQIGLTGDNDFLIELYHIRTEVRPENPQNWASLAYLYYNTGDNEMALSVLRDSQATATEPDFTATAQCFIDNIEAGNEPQVGC